MAIRLEQVFGSTADTWLRLQLQRDLWEAPTLRQDQGQPTLHHRGTLLGQKSPVSHGRTDSVTQCHRRHSPAPGREVVGIPRFRCHSSKDSQTDKQPEGLRVRSARCCLYDQAKVKALCRSSAGAKNGMGFRLKRIDSPA